MRQPFQLEAQQITNIDDLPLAHQSHVGNHHCIEWSGLNTIEHADLFDERRAAVMRFDLLEVDVFCQDGRLWLPNRAAEEHTALSYCGREQDATAAKLECCRAAGEDADRGAGNQVGGVM